MAEQMTMTHLKPKLPSFLSFPVGLEAITAALNDAPQLATLDLFFSADPILSATRFRRVIEADEPHPVLSIRFTRWDKKPSLGDDPWVKDYLNGKWSLWVYPVRRALKARAKDALVREGLPQIARWLTTARPSSWYWGRKRCDVVFVPSEGTLRIEELTEAS